MATHLSHEGDKHMTIGDGIFVLKPRKKRINGLVCRDGFICLVHGLMIAD
jgi:hypothetical protein